MSNYSDSEGSVIGDINPAFKGGSTSYYKKSKANTSGKDDKVKLVHSKLKDQEDEAEGEPEESEDSEFNEDEDMCDEEEQFLRNRKRQLKGKHNYFSNLYFKTLQYDHYTLIILVY